MVQSSFSAVSAVSACNFSAIPVQFQSSSRAVLEQFQCSFSAISVFQSSFSASSFIQSSFSATLMIQCSLGAVLVQLEWFRAVSVQFQCNVSEDSEQFRPVLSSVSIPLEPEWFQSSSSATSEQFPISQCSSSQPSDSNASVQFQCSFSATSVESQSNFRAISEQFQSSFSATATCAHYTLKRRDKWIQLATDDDSLRTCSTRHVTWHGDVTTANSRLESTACPPPSFTPQPMDTEMNGSVSVGATDANWWQRHPWPKPTTLSINSILFNLHRFNSSSTYHLRRRFRFAVHIQKLLIGCKRKLTSSIS